MFLLLAHHSIPYTPTFSSCLGVEHSTAQERSASIGGMLNKHVKTCPAAKKTISSAGKVSWLVVLGVLSQHDTSS
jgi:hypothetical protein